MDDVAEFLQVHRQKLLGYLDGRSPETPDDPGALDYIDQVLDEWAHKFGGRILPEPCRRERTFWFALYQLEDLVEYPVHGNIDPYERELLKILAEVREVLRDWSELTPEYHATRPGEAGNHEH